MKPIYIVTKVSIREVEADSEAEALKIADHDDVWDSDDFTVELQETDR